MLNRISALSDNIIVIQLVSHILLLGSMRERERARKREREREREKERLREGRRREL